MSLQTTVLSYHQTRLDALWMGGQMWLRYPQLAEPLGIKNARHVHDIYKRNTDEFTADETRLIVVQTEGGPQETRVFSLRGARLLALLVRTPVAKAFRRWVLDLLEGKKPRRAMQAELALPGTHRLPMEAVRALEDVQAIIEPDHPARAVIAEMIEGSRPLADDPALDRLVEQYEGAHKLQGEAQRYFSQVRAEAQRIGYTLEAVKRARRLRHG